MVIEEFPRQQETTPDCSASAAAKPLPGDRHCIILHALHASHCLQNPNGEILAQLTVRNVDEQVVRALKRRAAEHGRSAEAEHREILRRALLESGRAEETFAVRAARLRQRLRSGLDSAELIRTDRDRDTGS